ncbi:Cell division protein BolA [Gammaproteobacteria bacterium]
MSVCQEIKTFGRAHERIADFFSLLAVGLLFGSLWAGLAYSEEILTWMLDNPPLHGSLTILALVMDVVFIMMLLAIGSARFGGGEDERCFSTFRGRRHGGGSTIGYHP